MSYSDRELLARMVQCEAGGEGENRNESRCFCYYEQSTSPYSENIPEFHKDGSIRNILYQEGQFDCARESIYGKYNAQNIYNMNPTQQAYDIADWAIAGNRIPEVGECLWYMNPFIPTCPDIFPKNGSGTWHTRIINHCFYRPTPLYRET